MWMVHVGSGEYWRTTHGNPNAIKMTDDEFLIQMLNAGGTWPDTPLICDPMGVRLMQKGLIELIKPEVPYLPYAVLTVAGEKRARNHDDLVPDKQEQDDG